MKIGYIGLGKMGQNMVRRLLTKNYNVVAYNRSVEPREEARNNGAEVTESIKDLVNKLESPRKIWIMVSWQGVDAVLDELLPLLSPGDLIIDGGNSPYFETIKRNEKIKSHNIKFLDIGTSGGPAGALNGACLMIGGDKESFEENKKFFSDLSLNGDSFGYFGKNGAGHYVKMVHNGIEYGMMQAIGEGFELMKKSEEFELDLPEITRVYNKGSVIESRLIGWLSDAYNKYGTELESISGEISHSGEGEWTVQAADKLNVPVKIIKESLDFRKNSKGNPSYTGKVVSALRNQFGGHDVKEK